jgi:hypothetical protein
MSLRGRDSRTQPAPGDNPRHSLLRGLLVARVILLGAPTGTCLLPSQNAGQHFQISSNLSIFPTSH